MVYINKLKKYIDTLFPSAGTLLDWDKHKQINAAIIDGLAYATNPPGTAIPMISTIVPDGFHAFNGAELSREENPNLFDIWGITFGDGNGTTTFNCPSIPVGTSLVQFGTSPNASINLAFGAKGGELMHKLTGAESGTSEHVHTIKMGGEYGPGYGSGVQGSENGVSPSDAPVQKSTEEDAKSAHNNMPPYFAMNYIFRLC
jgi:microcystin-dependent protein